MARGASAGAATVDYGSAPQDEATPECRMRESVGPFRILRTLGQGGMGIVYEASDERQGRRVALKMLLPSLNDAISKERLRREARTAATFTHPHVCQVYEVGDGEDLYVAMELLDGEPLSARIARGPIPAVEAVSIGLQILSALVALHGSEILHRDLKPSNVHLTSGGVKLLDFGLALPMAGGSIEQRLTMTGAVLGTPQYMAPERWIGDGAIGPETDLFSVGALLFEMVTGRPAFTGRTAVEVAQAILSESSPSIEGSAGVDVLDRVIRTALEKKPIDRFPTAEAMSVALASAGDFLTTDTQTRAARSATRLLVMPFRPVRPDVEMEFLGQGIADAVTIALSGLRSLVMRSPHVAAKFAAPSLDLERIAREAGVDAVLIGTLLPGAGRLRVNAQLVEVPAGTLLWSERLDCEADDVLSLQDEIVRKTVESLSVPLSSLDRRDMRRKTPATARANELFMRANRIASVIEMLPAARDLYRQCVEEDPRFAPGWAQLGRVYRVMSKYGLAESAGLLPMAEQAFETSLRLDPDLSLAHHLYTYFEVEEGARALSAMVRLLRRVRERPAEADLFSALVLTCRFCGLLDASVAADRRARRLEPGIRTSVGFTHWARGEYEASIAADDESMRWLRLYALPMLGRDAEAIEVASEMETRATPGAVPMIRTTRAALRQDPAECVAATETLLARGLKDPESLYICARNLAHVGARERALDVFGRVVAGGYHLPDVFRRDPWLVPLRSDPRFDSLVATAEAGRAAAVEAFKSVGGASVLGSPREVMRP
jgi:eukaryotic-like serine/threonine-protein kinase